MLRSNKSRVCREANSNFLNTQKRLWGCIIQGYAPRSTATPQATNDAERFAPRHYASKLIPNIKSKPSSHRKGWESVFLLQMPCVAVHATKSTANPQATQNAQKLHMQHRPTSKPCENASATLGGQCSTELASKCRQNCSAKAWQCSPLNTLASSQRQLLHLTAR